MGFNASVAAGVVAGKSSDMKEVAKQMAHRTMEPLFAEIATAAADDKTGLAVDRGRLPFAKTKMGRQYLSALRKGFEELGYKVEINEHFFLINWKK